MTKAGVWVVHPEVGELEVAGRTTRLPGFAGEDNLDGFAIYVPNANRTPKAVEVVGGRNQPFIADADAEAKILEGMLHLRVCPICGDQAAV